MLLVRPAHPGKLHSACGEVNQDVPRVHDGVLMAGVRSERVGRRAAREASEAGDNTASARGQRRRAL